jgi:hypothetical protein
MISRKVVNKTKTSPLKFYPSKKISLPTPCHCTHFEASHIVGQLHVVPHGILRIPDFDPDSGPRFANPNLDLQTGNLDLRPRFEFPEAGWVFPEFCQLRMKCYTCLLDIDDIIQLSIMVFILSIHFDFSSLSSCPGPWRVIFCGL